MNKKKSAKRKKEEEEKEEEEKVSEESEVESRDDSDEDDHEEDDAEEKKEDGGDGDSDFLTPDRKVKGRAKAKTKAKAKSNDKDSKAKSKSKSKSKAKAAKNGVDDEEDVEEEVDDDVDSKPKKSSSKKPAKKPAKKKAKSNSKKVKDDEAESDYEDEDNAVDDSGVDSSYDASGQSSGVEEEGGDDDDDLEDFVLAKGSTQKRKTPTVNGKPSKTPPKTIVGSKATQKRKRTPGKSSKASKESDDIEDLAKKIEDHPAMANLNWHGRKYHEWNSSKEISEIRDKLLGWYDVNQRRLPWRKPSEKYLQSLGEDVKVDWTLFTEDSYPYAVMVSEIMLQQTQVSQVIPYFEKWMKEFPTLEALAMSHGDKVRQVWSGLGYYRRCNNLFATALTLKLVNCKIPNKVPDLMNLAGIGKYTAGAIASIAFGEVAPIVDGNVIRVFTRMRGIATDFRSGDAQKLFWKLGEEIVDTERPGDFNQALMELGATLCTVKNPQCQSCPLQSNCHAFAEVNKYKEITKKIDADESVKEPTGSEKSCRLCKDFNPTISVTKYPIKEPKKKKKVLHTAVCAVARYQKELGDYEYLLVKRPSEGLLADMFEFPSVDVDESKVTIKSLVHQILSKVRTLEEDNFFESIKCNAHKIEGIKRECVGETRHSFSHIDQYLFLDMIKVPENETVKIAPKVKHEWVAGSKMKKQIISRGTHKLFDMIQLFHEKERNSELKAQKRKQIDSGVDDPNAEEDSSEDLQPTRKKTKAKQSKEKEAHDEPKRSLTDTKQRSLTEFFSVTKLK